jgi:predicted Zn-dependent protease
VNWDEAAVVRWLEPLASRAGELADVFGERLREIRVEWRDGEAREAHIRREEGTGARWRARGHEKFVFASGVGEAVVRESVRALREETGKGTLPIRPSSGRPDPEDSVFPDAERWAKRLPGVFGRHAPRHRFVWRLRETERRVVSSGRPGSRWTRRLISLEGRFLAASRFGDEERHFSFHSPETDSTLDELKSLLSAAAIPRDRPTPVPGGEIDVVLANGCAAVLFHEILGHALEADADASPLSSLGDARVAVAELEVHDEAKRLDLFGGYDRDDEGTPPRSVKLVHAGGVGSRLTDRAHAGAAGSTGHGRRAGPADAPRPRGSNIVVRNGGATPEELARRLHNGIWIEEFRGGSVELSNGTFRLQFPRARRIRRGRLADELGPGILAGELLPTLKGIEPVLGRDLHVCRSLGWCARGGQVIPVQGASPDILIRRLTVRSAP